MNRGRIARLFLVFALGATVIVASAGDPNAAGAQSQAQPFPPGARFVPNQVVIQFRADVDESDKASARARANAAFAKQLRTSREGDLELSSVPTGIALADAIRNLRGHPSVRFAEPNWIYTHDETSNDPYYTDGSLWGMYGDTSSPANQYGSQSGEAWAAGKVGSNAVYIAVTDHGVNFDHPDLKANVWTNPFDPVNGVDDDGNGYVDDVHGWDFANDDSSVYDLRSEDETNGHGSHVTGTIGALGGNGSGVAGVNWKVTIVVTKYLGDSGGTTANTPRVIDYLIDLKNRHGLNIVASNNSYGGSGYSQAVSDAIGRANTAGILFVASAGNDSRDNDATPRYPSSYPHDNIIAVAALNKDGALRSSSNWGATSVDIGAPGGEVWSTLANGYGIKSGTSMAAPHVTGATALYASAHPDASAAQIKNAIMTGAAPTASLTGKVLSNGRLDVFSGLGLSGPAPVPTSTPTATATSTPLTATSTPTLTPTSTPTATATPTASPSAPAPPSNLSAEGRRNFVRLNWSPSTTSGVTYNVYRGTTAGGQLQLYQSGVTTDSYQDRGVVSGTTYYYRVTARNAAGESAPSNEATATAR